MDLVESDLRTFFGALKAWLVARCWNALVVGALWLLGLWLLHVPWAPLWAVLGALLQFIPNFGAMLALIGAEFGALLSGDAMRMLYVLILYAGIVVVDAWVLEPLLMKRTARVPIWASIFAPGGPSCVLNNSASCAAFGSAPAFLADSAPPFFVGLGRSLVNAVSSRIDSRINRSGEVGADTARNAWYFGLSASNFFIFSLASASRHALMKSLP